MASFDTTLDKIIALRPDRIAAYSYAHLPELFKAQRLIRPEDMPPPERKLELLELTIRPPFQYIKMQSWRNAASPLAHLAIPNAYLHDDLRLVNLTEVKTGITVPEFGVS